MRDHKNFKTIECFKNLKSLFISNNSTVLIDCMSNLVANEMYLEGGAKDKTVQEVIRGIESINNQAENLVIVTNEVFSDGIVYDDDTMRYIRNLGEINKEIGKKADNVVEVVYSIPIFHKGGI